MIQIFLSRPNPFTCEQAYFLKLLEQQLNKVNMKNITLEAKDYNPHESLTCLLEMIKRCYGMIVVALGQYYIEIGTSKYGAINNKNFFESYENPLDQLWVTSPFCQIEGAIAFGNKLPILILEQYNVKIEGILKEGGHAIHAPKFSVENNTKIETYFKSFDFLHKFNEWAEQVTTFYDFINTLTE